MRHSDFVIGQDFMTATGVWKCTDIGSRTITAIRYPDPEHEPKEHAARRLWMQGPPYALPEEVFDEKELRRAYRSIDEHITDAMDSFHESAHPNFASEDVERMMKVEIRQLRKRNKPYEARYREPLMNHDRVAEERIFHPYGWRDDEDGNAILALDIFNREWAEWPLLEWLSFPVSTEENLVAAKLAKEAERREGDNEKAQD